MKRSYSGLSLMLIALLLLLSCSLKEPQNVRETEPINEGWKFFKYESFEVADRLIYDVRPEEDGSYKDSKDADSRPDEAVDVETTQDVLKPWIMPSGNDFIKDKSKHYTRPDGHPGNDFPFVQADFDDEAWKDVNLPHDWAIAGPFYEGWDAEVGGGMGRLPSHGVGWYRKKLDIAAGDKGKMIFLDAEGIMSHAMVWLNGKLVGGWPYGYNSFRLDLTPYVDYGGVNQLAIRVDNPNNSARWYPGGGIYREMWLTKTNPVHISQWGTKMTTPDVSKEKASLELEVSIDNETNNAVDVEFTTHVYKLDENDQAVGTPVTQFEKVTAEVKGESALQIKSGTIVNNPDLWGPIPQQTPHRYVAITTLKSNGKIVDKYQTPFGIRKVEMDPDAGFVVNGELIKLQGVNEHHDLGALGAAFNVRAAERKLEILQEMGCNAIRMAHNPPAPALLNLCDKMGFLVIDEVFDSWERKKTPHDFHLIFPEWNEQDLRSMIRRDMNHPSIIVWSYGNEVGEQYTWDEGAAIAQRLHDICKDEDPSRPTTSAMNFAKSDFPFSAVPDVIGFNYQGEGIRQDPIFDDVKNRIKTKPQYIPFKKQFPDKVILSSETASAFSSRGIYYFPVTDKISSPSRDGMGGNSKETQVSAYELYAVDFGSSADKVFASLDKHPFSAGEFVWTGFDYLGEPTPYYENRSSYNGILDLAGFKKDRFYLYQARWRPDLPMVHLLPHWNWPDRVGKVTPIHVFTSGDAAEVFLNGRSLGKKKKAEFEYRLRWDDVMYEPGEVKVVAYKNGSVWAEDKMVTTGAPYQLAASADRTAINADGSDLSYITVDIQDADGLFVTNATNTVEFSIEGPGEIVATDNGDPSCMVEFPSKVRPAFSGKVLAIVRSKKGDAGKIRVIASAQGLNPATVEITSK